MSAFPLVSVVTPVHNGEPYLAECIESVLAQTYEHWEYTVSDNASTDHSLDIASAYARKDSRIRVVSTDRLLNVMASQNFAFRQVSPDAAYCKMVHADDWLLPDCLRLMVEVAEANPTVGLVGSYRLDARPEIARIGSGGLPLAHTANVVPGREVRVRSLRGQFSVGSASCLLIRADYVRRRPDLMAEDEVFGDLGAWYEILASSDFGFVHQVLTGTRLHSATITSGLANLEGDWHADLSLLKKYGAQILGPEEFEQRLTILLRRYHNVLAERLLAGNGGEFIRYHRKALERLGYSLTWKDLAWALLRRGLYPLRHPGRTLGYAASRVRAQRLSGGR